jgi:hypothetical protein
MHGTLLAAGGDPCQHGRQDPISDVLLLGRDQFFIIAAITCCDFNRFPAQTTL